MQTTTTAEMIMPAITVPNLFIPITTLKRQQELNVPVVAEQPNFLQPKLIL